MRSWLKLVQLRGPQTENAICLPLTADVTEKSAAQLLLTISSVQDVIVVSNKVPEEPKVEEAVQPTDEEAEPQTSAVDDPAEASEDEPEQPPARYVSEHLEVLSEEFTSLARLVDTNSDVSSSLLC